MSSVKLEIHFYHFQCRIWRDRNKLNASGEALSRGFGFVNFLNHQDALSAMKHLNNNPDIFTKEKVLLKLNFLLEWSLGLKKPLISKIAYMILVSSKQLL